MRRTLTKTLCCVTAILLAFQVFTLSSFGQEANITNDGIQSAYTEDKDTSVYETIKDKHGYKTIAYPEQVSSLLQSGNSYQTADDSTVGRADLNNFVRLSVPVKTNEIYSVELNYRNYYSDTGYYYTNYSQCAQYTEMDEAQTTTTITLGEFDWSRTDSYIIIVDTVKGIFRADITQANLTSTIALKMDSTYTTAKLSVPFDLTTYSYFGLDFLVYDDQGQCITNYYMSKYDMEQGYKIPSGKYKVQAFADGASNPFSLFKTSYINLTPSSNTISFSSSEMNKVSFRQTAGNSSGIAASIENVGFLQDNFRITYGVDASFANGVSYVYVTKGTYGDVRFHAILNDDSNWRYLIDETNVNTSSGPVTIDYDLAFKAQFTKPTYDIYGRSTLGRFFITNNNEQLVTDIIDSDGIRSNKNIKLEKGSEAYIFNVSSEYINVPNPWEPGTFSVDFSVKGPLTVTPVKDSIYINRSSTKADDAQIYVSAPFSMSEGQQNHIYVTVWNLGTNIWTSSGGYKLVAVGGSDPFTTTLSYPIPEGLSLKENRGYVFEIPITAPTRGIYTSDWQMMKGTTAFGNIAATEIHVRSLSNPYKATPLSITSLLPDKASPQLTGTTIRWTCKISGGKAPVYYFKIFKGSTLVKSSTAYTNTNYFDWTPTEAGTDYRALVYVKENGAANSTSLTKYSSYYTVKAATISIKSISPNKPSPQLTNTTIRWICSIDGGVKPVYYFRVYKGTTLVKNSAAYSATNYFDWTPTEAGTDYRVLVNVKENGAANSTSLTKYSSYYTISKPVPIVIKSLVPDKASPQLTNTKIRWTCSITGGVRPVYYFRVYKGTTLVKNSAAYSATNYFDWTPTAAGTDYRVLVNVKEDGLANSTSVSLYSGYYTITAPIVISSLVPDKASPQPTGTKIRWTCNITGGNKPVYYFKIFKGSTVVSSSTAYTTTNYFDWTPAEAGTDYRALVYVREPGSASSTIVTKYSSYYTVTAPPTPIVIKSLVPDKSSPQLTGTTIRWTCGIIGGAKPVYYFRVYKGSTLVKNSPAYSTTNYFDWIPTEAGTDYRILVNVKEDGTANSTSVTMYSSYYTVTAPPAPIVITSLMPDKTSPQPIGTVIRWTCNITGGTNPIYFFKIYKGSTLISASAAYTTSNYFDWTPPVAGTDFRAQVYVRERVSGSTVMTKYSSYYTVTEPPAPKVTETPGPEETDPGLGGINIKDIPLVR